MTRRQRESKQDAREAQREMQAEQSARQAASAAMQQKVQKRLENPEFFQQLRDADVDSEAYPWLERELGPDLSGAHVIANRDEGHERAIKWLGDNRAERKIAERDPGRLCEGHVRAIAQGVHKRRDKGRRDELTPDEKRAIRAAHRAGKALESLGLGAKGLESITQATAVSKVEKNEEESNSLRERAGRFLG